MWRVVAMHVVSGIMSHSLVVVSHRFRVMGVPGAYMEPAAMEQWAFYQQLHTFNANGYAEDYASGTVVGDVVGVVYMCWMTDGVGGSQEWEDKERARWS